MTFRVGWIDDHELGFQALVLQDEGLDETLEVQGGDRHADRDGPLRQDACCLVRNGAAVIYGGVVCFSLSGARLTVELTSEAADVLALPLVVPYDLDEDGLVLVQQRLPEICPDLVRKPR